MALREDSPAVTVSKKGEDEKDEEDEDGEEEQLDEEEDEDEDVEGDDDKDEVNPWGKEYHTNNAPLLLCSPAWPPEPNIHPQKQDREAKGLQPLFSALDHLAEQKRNREPDRAEIHPSAGVVKRTVAEIMLVGSSLSSLSTPPPTS
ncbi:hypothetical protein H8959_016812 [Pygathrix nigripes]